MSETLVIEIGADGRSVVQAGLVAEDGAWLQSVSPGALGAHAGVPAILVLNGTLVMSQSVAVPAFPDEKLLKVLPGLMEGHMALSGEPRHYALMGARHDETGERPVVVMASDVMSTLLGDMRALGLNVVAALPDYRLAGESDVLELADRIIMAHPDGTGFTAEKAQATFMLDEEVKPQLLSGAEWQARLAMAPAVEGNLLQGAFGPRADLTSWLLWFRIPGVLALVAFLIWGASIFYQASDNFNRAEALHGDAEASFREALPDVRRIVNMETQMRRAIMGLRQQGGSEFLVLSSLAAKAVAAGETTTMESMRFDGEDGTLVMEVSFASFAAGEAFKAELQRLGLLVVEGGSRSEGGRVISELTVRRQV